MDASISSDTEDEVFFGPIVAREIKKASKLRRTTQVFLPTFRNNMNGSSCGPSRSEWEDHDSLSDDDDDDDASIEADPSKEVQTQKDDIVDTVTGSSLSSNSSYQETLKKMKGASPTQNSPFLKIVSKLTKNENDNSEKKESPFQKKTKALFDFMHRTREEWSSPTRSPSTASLSESGTEFPFKRKLISTPLANQASPRLNKVPKIVSECDSVQNKDGGVCQTGKMLTEEREALTQSRSIIKEQNDLGSHQESSDPDSDVERPESQSKTECSISLCEYFTQVDEFLSDERVERNERERREVSEEDVNSRSMNLKPVDELSGIENLDSSIVAVDSKLDICLEEGPHLHVDEKCSGQQDEDVLQPTKVSAFTLIHNESGSDSSGHCHQSLIHVPCLKGQTSRDTDESANLCSSLPHNQEVNICNKENSVTMSLQSDSQKVLHDEATDAVSYKDKDTFTESAVTEVMNSNSDPQTRGTSNSVHALQDRSNLMFGERDTPVMHLTESPRNSPMNLRDLRVNPQYFKDNMNMHNRSPIGSHLQVAVALGTSPQMKSCSLTSVQVDSPMSLRRKLVEQKKAQLMRLKQAKDEMKHQILQDDKRQFNKQMEIALALQSNVSSPRPTAETINRIEASPNDTSFDELTRFYTWKNSQLVAEENYPFSSPQCIHSVKQDRPHLKWTDNLVIEVTELSSPSKPAPRRKSILNKRIM